MSGAKSFCSSHAFPPGGFGIERGLTRDWIEENQPSDFHKWQGAVALLVPHPSKTWTASFIEKNFEKPGRVNVAGPDRVWIFAVGR